MTRFVKWFYEFNTPMLVDKINAYADNNNLTIISMSTSADQHGAIVLFEKNRPKC